MAISPERQEQIHKERKKQIIDTAYYLFFKNGYSNTTVSDIAKEAGISKGLIYRYYKSKEELLLTEQEETLLCLKSYLEDPSPKHALLTYMKSGITNPKPGDYIGQLRILFDAILQGEIQDETYNIDYVNRHGIEFFTPIFRKGQEIGEFREGNPEAIADLFWHMLLGYAITQGSPKHPAGATYTPEEILHFFEK